MTIEPEPEPPTQNPAHAGMNRSGDYKRFKRYLKDAQNQDEKLQKKISLLQSSMFRGLKQADMFKQYFVALEEADRLWTRRKDDIDVVCELKRILPQVLEVFPGQSLTE